MKNKLTPPELLNFPGTRGESFYTLFLMNQNRPLHIRLSDSIINSSLAHTVIHLHRTHNGNLCFEKITERDQLLSIFKRWVNGQPHSDALSTRVTFWQDDKQSNMRLDNAEVVSTHCLSNQGFTRIYTLGENELKKALGKKIYNISWDKLAGAYSITTLDGREISNIRYSNSGTLKIKHSASANLNPFHSMKTLFTLSYNRIDKIQEHRLVKALEYFKERCRLCLRNLFGVSLMRISIGFKLNATDQIEFQTFNEIIITAPKLAMKLPVPVYNKPCIRHEAIKRTVKGNAVEEIRKLKEKMRKLLYNRDRYKSMTNFSISDDLNLKHDIKKEHYKSKSIYEIIDDELSRSVNLLDSYLSLNNTSSMSTTQLI